MSGEYDVREKRLGRWKDIIRQSFSHRAGIQGYYNIPDDESSWSGVDSDDEDACPVNTMFVKSVSGAGKTSSVKALATELGFKVMEINTSSLRSHKNLLAALDGVTHSHRVIRHGNPATFFTPSTSGSTSVLDPGLRGPAMKKSQSLNHFPSQRSHKEQSVPKSASSSAADPCVIDCASSTSEEEAAKHQAPEKKLAKFSMILIDDVDVVFPCDEFFWNGMTALAEKSRVPIILTASREFDVDETLFPCRCDSVCLEKPERELMSYHLVSLLLAWKSTFVSRKSMLDLIDATVCDPRACLNTLQLWLQSTTSTPQPLDSTYGTPSGTPANTIPQSVIQDLKTTKMDSDPNFVAENSLLNGEEYVDLNTAIAKLNDAIAVDELHTHAAADSRLRFTGWKSRVAVNTNDSPYGWTDTWLQRRRAMITTEMCQCNPEWSRYQSERPLDLDCIFANKDTLSQMEYVSNGSNSGPSNMEPRDYAMEYLPALYAMGLAQEISKVSEARRRFHHYFDKLHIDPYNILKSQTSEPRFKLTGCSIFEPPSADVNAKRDPTSSLQNSDSDLFSSS